MFTSLSYVLVGLTAHVNQKRVENVFVLLDMQDGIVHWVVQCLMGFNVQETVFAMMEDYTSVRSVGDATCSCNSGWAGAACNVTCPGGKQ